MQYCVLKYTQYVSQHTRCHLPHSRTNTDNKRIRHEARMKPNSPEFLQLQRTSCFIIREGGTHVRVSVTCCHNVTIKSEEGGHWVALALCFWYCFSSTPFYSGPHLKKLLPPKSERGRFPANFSGLPNFAAAVVCRMKATVGCHGGPL